MPPSVNWSTKRVTIPQSDLTLVSGVLYQLDLETFRNHLHDIEDNEDGMVFPDIHSHNSQVTLSGVTYAQTVEIINGYTVDFQNTGSPYTVRCVGANHNVADVFVPGASQVSLIIGNSAGLIVVSSGSGLSPAQDAALTGIKSKTDQLAFTGGQVDANILRVNSLPVDGSGTDADPWGPA